MPSFFFCKAFVHTCRGCLLATTLLALVGACSSTRAHVHVPASAPHIITYPRDSVPIVPSAADLQPAADSEADDDSSETVDDDTVYQNPSDCIEEAKSYCDDSDFAAADSALRQAVHAVEAMDQRGDAGAERLPSSKYFDEIAIIYKQKMPASYSLPDDIAAAVFQGQLMRSIDSMSAGPLDSVALAAIACQKGVEYDVPVVWNQRVQRALSFYVRNRDVTIDHWFSRATYYVSFMRKMFADSGLPKDLAYLPLIESGFNPLAYSYANASGIWQFIASTGKLYGLRRSFWLDERRDPVRSTEAAIGYLKKLFGEFGNWHLALAAYNCGENGVSHSIARHGTNDYWRLKRLPRQTKNYVPCYLAALTIAKNPKCFGVSINAADTLSLDTVHVKESISLNDIADGLGVNRDALAKMNPHILRWCTPCDTSGVLVYLPAGKKRAWNAFYANLPAEKRVQWYRYEIKRGDDIAGVASRYSVPADALSSINRITAPKLTPGHHLFIPVSAVPLPANVAYSAPPESEIKALDLPDYEYSGISIRHRVRPGDNLGRIARRYHVRVTQLCRWNHVTGKTILRPGRILLVSRPLPPPVAEAPPPAVAAAAPVHAPAETAAAPASPAQTPLPVLEAPKPALPAATAAAPAQTHVVEIGETPFSVSRRFDIRLGELAALNGLNLAHPIIKIGQTLIVKAPAAAVPVAHTAPVSSAVPAAASGTDAAQPGTAKSDSGTPMVGQSEHKGQDKIYVIAKGEDLFRISLRYSVSVDSLMTANRITDVLRIREGDTLRIPLSAETVARSAVAPPPETGVIYYKVKDGDTLVRIAAEFGVPVDSLYKENKMKSDTVLIPGKVIRVVKASGM